MAGTSKYLQITDQILVEYIYTDQANPDSIKVSDSPIEILTNGITNENYIFSSNTGMGNLRDKSAIPTKINRSEYAYLNKDLPVNFIDFNPHMTSSTNLVQNFVSPTSTNIIYDTIKIHLRAGFSFVNIDGYIFDFAVTRRDSIKIHLSSLAFLKSDNYYTLNPKPFLVGDKLFTTYIELKVPAIAYLLPNNDVNPPVNADSLNSRLTSKNIQTNINPDAKTLGQGFLKSTTIDVTLYDIFETKKINGFTYFSTREVVTSSLSQKDNFDLLVAHLEEATDGDYYNIYGEYNGVIFEDFINTLNNQAGNNYIAFHEISVTEQVLTNMIPTTSLTMIQSDNWGDPILYRPVIINSSNAVSYTITYTLRLINKADNSQIIKSAQLTSFNPKRYGKKMQRLNLGTVPTIMKVYNKVVQNNITVPTNTLPTNTNTVNGDIVIKTEYIDVFRDRINIKVSASKVNIKQITS